MNQSIFGVVPIKNGLLTFKEVGQGDKQLMQGFERYPHVRDIIEHYAREQNNTRVLALLESGVQHRDDAYLFARFVILVVECIARDFQQQVIVLGGLDNSDMIPDIAYEVGLFLADSGFEDVWDQVCDEA